MNDGRCRDQQGRFVGISNGYEGGNLLHRVQLQDCLRHCLKAHTVRDTESPREGRPGIITAEEMVWFRKIIKERPEWAQGILSAEGFTS